MKFICYPKCSTCQKAKKWLDENKIEYTERHIVDDNPTYEELKNWYGRSGLPLKRFFNTSGMLYKEMKMKDKLPDMSEDEQLQLLATNGMLVKRPLVVDDGFVLTGFKEKEWTEKILYCSRDVAFVTRTVPVSRFYKTEGRFAWQKERPQFYKTEGHSL